MNARAYHDACRVYECGHCFRCGDPCEPNDRLVNGNRRQDDVQPTCEACAEDVAAPTGETEQQMHDRHRWLKDNGYPVL